MPSIHNVTLSVVRDTANVDITIDYDLAWDSFDQATNQPYEETWEILGENDLVGPWAIIDVRQPPLLGVAVRRVVLRADGTTEQHRQISFTVPVDVIDTHAERLDGQEVRAKVRLTPTPAPVVEAISNRVVVLDA